MLLADFHIHTTWSDGKLSIPEVVDLFGRAGHDAIAITDHVVNSDTLVGKATHRFGLTVTERNFGAYREEIEREKRRALDQYGMVVIPGFELTQNAMTRKNSAHVLALDQYGMVVIPGFELTQNAMTRKNSAHVLALGVDEFISADGSVEEMLTRAQKQSRIVVACHPHEQSDWFSNTFYLWNRRNEVAHLVDLWEVACRFDLFPPVARARLPYIGNSDFHREEHLYAWKTLVPARKNELAIFRALEQGTGLGVTRLAAPFSEVSA